MTWLRQHFEAAVLELSAEDRVIWMRMQSCDMAPAQWAVGWIERPDQMVVQFDLRGVHHLAIRVSETATGGRYTVIGYKRTGDRTVAVSDPMECGSLRQAAARVVGTCRRWLELVRSPAVAS